MMMARDVRLRPGWPTEVLISADRIGEHRWADWLRGKLEPNGLAVHRAYSGDEALEVVRAGSLSLAVLGTQAPRSGGLALLRQIRSVDARLPCVLVAGGIDGRYLRKALELKAYSVLTTPVDQDILRDLIAAVFRRFYESELVI